MRRVHVFNVSHLSAIESEILLQWRFVFYPMMIGNL
ncbi:hypothetical protein AGR1A_Lc100011 [Agrobacterium fabacearum CFBP 5771]|nr:hypothetical protein AGR1A_Lc100011 [Agrobacterium fabacearum CFBP 5771]